MLLGPRWSSLGEATEIFTVFVHDLGDPSDGHFAEKLCNWQMFATLSSQMIDGQKMPKATLFLDLSDASQLVKLKASSIT